MKALGWLADPAHGVWLQGEEARLIGFPRARTDAHGHAVQLDASGGAVPGPCAPTFLTARMAFVHAVAALRGHPGMRSAAGRMLDALAAQPGPGWPDHPAAPATASAQPRRGLTDHPPALATPAGAGADAPDALQSLYTLDFVILAAAAGVAIDEPGASTLLRNALERFDTAFWEPTAQLGVDRIDAAGQPTPYRGMNANMHLVEALLAAFEVTGETEWRDRALAICRFVIAEAAGRDWRICEHYTADWVADPGANRDRPDHAFVPFGYTVGHGFEWSRLIAQCSALPGTEGFVAAANSLFERPAVDGWARDGADGFLYTTDFDGEPVSTMHLHWVAAEAIAAASVLARLPGGSPGAAAQYELWLDHIDEAFIDCDLGSWRQRLGAPADAAKPDLYHSLQSVLIPQLPVAPSVLAALRAR
ncbi:AGE family epimerase/isomerase [Subtercola sp. YIM 133946]|uniref:AGE family epimerase/isomerase n=1 Tax=Subtercola sp. YIM 133946 TaxID=3118909 RepID=UPI002F92FC7C